jgi:hypothetical protein
MAAVHPAAMTRRSGAASAPSRRRSAPAGGEDPTTLARPLRRRRAHGTGAREPAVRLSPPPASWDVGEASSSASASWPIAGRRRGDLEEEEELAWALAESATTAAAKKRREEEKAAAAVELFKLQKEIEARAWAQRDGEVATSEGDAEAGVILVDSD